MPLDRLTLCQGCMQLPAGLSLYRPGPNGPTRCRELLVTVVFPDSRHAEYTPNYPLQQIGATTLRANRVRHVARFLVLNTAARTFLLPPQLRITLYRLCGVQIGAHTDIFPGTVIRPGRITIGSGCFINNGCILDPGTALISIGDRVAIAPRVILVGNSHEIGRPSSRAGKMVSADIRIGDGCWLGTNVIVMPGVTIASGCIIGAGSVVTRDTVPDGVYVGSPARRVRTLSDDQPER